MRTPATESGDLVVWQQATDKGMIAATDSLVGVTRSW